MNTYQLHHNVDQWGDNHDQFIPERFDPDYCSKNPQPQRHPMSFLPFSGGKLVCIGKTFAETAFKVVVPMLLKAFDNEGRFGEFMNNEHYSNKPENNGLMFERPEIKIRILAK